MLILAVGIFVLLLFIIGIWLLQRWETKEMEKEAALISQQVADEEQEALVRFQGKWYKERNDLETVLLIGLDKFEDEISQSEEEFMNHQQADFLALLIVDKTSGSYRVLHLNRDTIADVPRLDLMGHAYDTYPMQLALSHTYGSGGKDSGRNTAEAVSNLLYGIKINHFVSVTMDSVGVINDMVGGVTVFVEDDFSRVDPTIVQGENVTLHGQQALHFVRARSSMEEPTNLARMARQRAYLKSLWQELRKCVESDAEFGPKALLTMSEYMVSDCTINQLADLFDVMSLIDEPEVENIKGEAVEGEMYMEYYVDEDALQEQVIRLFYQETQK